MVAAWRGRVDLRQEPGSRWPRRWGPCLRPLSGGCGRPRQNLLGDHHFSEDTGELTRAGQLKVHWVLSQAPPEHRQIFVTRLPDQKLTNRRLAKVRSYATSIATDGMPPFVSDTHLISEGRPAATVDSINTAFRDSMPTPTLHAASLGDGQ